jgi:hypothetical protein
MRRKSRGGFLHFNRTEHAIPSISKPGANVRIAVKFTVERCGVNHDIGMFIMNATNSLGRGNQAHHLNIPAARFL